VIAYELSRDLGVPVPPAFLALGPGNGAPGVLVEFFYGHPFESETRFVHAIDHLQGLSLPVDFRRGSLKDNITLCRLHRTPDWRGWWGGTLALDAIIGNTDRHTENWGFLIRPGSPVNYELAPAFDNGTSLGHIIREEDLQSWMVPAKMRALLARGRHHFGWVSGESDSAQHARLCRVFCDHVTGGQSAMDDALFLTDNRISRIVQWCCSFDFPLPFTGARAEFVEMQLRARRDALTAALGA
jgi:hypothetical protein